MRESTRQGVSAAVILGVALTSGCSKAGPTAPATVNASVPVLPPAPTLRIVGLPEIVQKSSRTPLTAEIVSTGPEQCPLQPVWSVDNSTLAVLAGGCDRCAPPVNAHELLVKYSGYVNVTATCGALTATQRVRIEDASPVADVSDPIVGGGGEAGSEIELLDGARKGERFPASTFYSLNKAGLVFPLRARLTARFFEPREFEFSSATSNGFARGFPDSTFSIPMTFVGDANTDTYTCCNVPTYDEPISRYPFTTKRTGLIEVSLYHDGGDSSRAGVTVELWCSGALVQRQNTDQFPPYAGVAISQQVAGPAACEVRAARTGNTFYYRIATTYPH